MPSPDRHFANAAIFTHSTGLTPNSGDAALYIKSDNKAYIKDSAGAELPVGGTKTYAVFNAQDNQPPATNFATLDTRNSIAILDLAAQLQAAGKVSEKLNAVKGWTNAILAEYVQSAEPKEDWGAAPFSFNETVIEAYHELGQ
jgi:hypothetical protein